MKVTYEIVSNIPSTIFVSKIDNKHYIVPSWKEVPVGTTVDQIIHIPWKPEISWTQLDVIKGPRGGEYKISKSSKGQWGCSCSTFKPKSGCKHIMEYILKTKINA